LIPNRTALLAINAVSHHFLLAERVLRSICAS
jgi:hypothetical protein